MNKTFEVKFLLSQNTKKIPKGNGEEDGNGTSNFEKPPIKDTVGIKSFLIITFVITFEIMNSFETH